MRCHRQKEVTSGNRTNPGLGESRTGKSRIAVMIHDLSARRHRPPSQSLSGDPEETRISEAATRHPLESMRLYTGLQSGRVVP
jgi:hypothetical protein